MTDRYDTMRAGIIPEVATTQVISGILIHILLLMMVQHMSMVRSSNTIIIMWIIGIGVYVPILGAHSTHFDSNGLLLLLMMVTVDYSGRILEFKVSKLQI